MGEETGRSPTSRRARGMAGEAEAARLVEAEGWTVVARNFRSRTGEIDLVAAKDGVLAFIEVKTWRSWGPEELETSIGATKRRRIVETAKFFLSRYREYSSARVRFDVLWLDGRGTARRIESAFTGEL